MDVLKPITFSPGMVAGAGGSSSILEPDSTVGEVAFSATEWLIKGDRRISTLPAGHKVYEVIAGPGVGERLVLNGPQQGNASYPGYPGYPTFSHYWWQRSDLKPHNFADNQPIRLLNGASGQGSWNAQVYYKRPAVDYYASINGYASPTFDPALYFALAAVPGSNNYVGANYPYSPFANAIINGFQTAVDPSADLITWAEVEPTNKFRPFDGVISTKAERASSIQYVIVPGTAVTAVYVDGLVGSTISLRVLNASNVQQGPTLTKALDGAAIGGTWQQYLFAQSDNIREATFTGLPWATGYKIEITVNANTGSAKIGEIILGNIYSFGKLQYGAEAGIRSFSGVSQNAFGKATRVKRPNAKTYTGVLRLTDAEMDKVSRFLADVESVPCVWIGVPGLFTATLTVYGTYRSFKQLFKDSGLNFCTLEIEGEV